MYVCVCVWFEAYRTGWSTCEMLKQVKTKIGRVYDRAEGRACGRILLS